MRHLRKHMLLLVLAAALMGLPLLLTSADEQVYQAGGKESLYALSGDEETLYLVSSGAVYRYDLETRQMARILAHDDTLIDVSCDGNTALLLGRDGTIYTLTGEDELIARDRVEEESLFAFTPLRLTHAGQSCFVLVLDSETQTNRLFYQASEDAPWVAGEGVAPLDVAAGRGRLTSCCRMAQEAA